MNKQHLVLIGMPGSGKSTIGQEVAQRMQMDFIDVDDVIESTHKATLAQLIDTHGLEKFLELEAQACESINPTYPTVISPGGSVIYNKEGMAALQKLGLIVFIDPSDEELQNRLGDLQARGVVVKPGQTLSDLVAERRPYYEKYADEHLYSEGLSINESAEEVIAFMEANCCTLPMTAEEASHD